LAPAAFERMSCWWLLTPQPNFEKICARHPYFLVGLKIKKDIWNHPDVILYSCIVQVKPSSWCRFEKLHGCRVTLRTALPCFVRYKPKVLKPCCFGDRKKITNLNRSKATKTKHPTNIDPTVAYKNGQDVSGKSWEYWLNHGVSVYLREFQCSLGSTQLDKTIYHPQKTKPALGSGSS